MEEQSPFLGIKRLETELQGRLAALDIVTLPVNERKLISGLKNELIDARLDIRDYELSETREEQLRKAGEARQRLERIRKMILGLSEYNVFGSVDVAQLSAELEQISEQVR